MKPRSGRGWVSYSAVVLSLTGIFGIIGGLTAVYKSTFYTANAVFVFSDLNTWGWIIFGLGTAALVSGLAVLSGSEFARWLGVTVASLGALGQLLFSQAYPLWSLIILSLNFLVIYGLVAHGGHEREVEATSTSQSTESGTSGTVTDMGGRSTRAA